MRPNGKKSLSDLQSLLDLLVLGRNLLLLVLGRELKR